MHALRLIIWLSLLAFMKVNAEEDNDDPIQEITTTMMPKINTAEKTTEAQHNIVNVATETVPEIQNEKHEVSTDYQGDPPFVPDSNEKEESDEKSNSATVVETSKPEHEDNIKEVESTAMEEKPLKQEQSAEKTEEVEPHNIVASNIDQSSDMEHIPEATAEAAVESEDTTHTIMVTTVKPPLPPTPTTITPPHPILKCYSCNSAKDPGCVLRTEKQLNCAPAATNTTNGNGCFTLVNVDTNVTTRGCISELVEPDMTYCRKNSKRCVFCYESLCNNLKAPISSGVAKLNDLCVWLPLTVFVGIIFMHFNFIKI